MCGITGFIDLKKQSNRETLECLAKRMADSIGHRGPDSDGFWVDETTGVALGHRRLAIVDLSPTGYQPMFSASGRYIIIFNGEVYNFCDIRADLERRGHTFRGTSDTEVMLAAFEEWGVESAIAHFNGMFAFAVWDQQEHILHLVRDRLGIKPIYYGWVNDVFLFGSELKALRSHPLFKGDINRDALALFFRYAYIPVPHSIYHGIYKQPPGTILSICVDDPLHHPQPQPFWSAREAALKGRSEQITSEQEALEELRRLLSDAVKIRMIADVPLGAFLSGGIDSSVVVALMQAQSSQPVRTFTIGFYEEAYNEAKYAKAVAEHLGTDHTELYLTAAEAMAVIPRLPVMYDEPFADSSQIPTFLVSQLARQHVTVSLSGDGGDELFAGYVRYGLGQRTWNQMRRIPRLARCMIASGLATLAPETWERILTRVMPLLPPGLRYRHPGIKVHKLAHILRLENNHQVYNRLVSYWESARPVVVGGTEADSLLTDQQQWTAFDDFMLAMMYLDTVTYLPDDILTKLDRASMAVSLEGRVPLLDYRVVELAWRIPLSMKLQNGRGKWLLRQLLYQYVPRTLIDRPKTGFGIPVDQWLRTDLREWAEALIAPERLNAEGFFNPEPIHEKWQQHLSGKYDWSYPLWCVLMFQSWYAQF
jgi:asparagine synthase (glutamine-hydrolysing)